MDSAIVRDVLIQVPVTVVAIGGLTYALLKVLTIILDKQGHQFERQNDLIQNQTDQLREQGRQLERLVLAVGEMGQRCLLLQPQKKSRR